MAELLNYSKKTARERGKYFICLMPAEKSLFDYYGKFGYKTIFSRKILRIKSTDSEYGFVNDFIGQAISDDYYNLRQNAFKRFDRFEWDAESIAFACKQHLLYGGLLKNHCKGYMLYNKKADEVIVKEFAFSDKNFNDIISQLFRETSSDTVVVYLPSDFPTNIGEYEITGSAMAVTVKSEYDSLISDINNAYLGLTLD